jgi:hypothetical protein
MSGGSEESRTPVRKYFHITFFERSWWFEFRFSERPSAGLGNCYLVGPVQYRELLQGFPVCSMPGLQSTGKLKVTRALRLGSQCEIVIIIFSVYF